LPRYTKLGNQPTFIPSPINYLLDRVFLLHLPNDFKEKSDLVPVKIIFRTSVSKAAVRAEMARMPSLVLGAVFAAVAVDELPKSPPVVDVLPKPEKVGNPGALGPRDWAALDT
jgi:hypothetical protein